MQIPATFVSDGQSFFPASLPVQFPPTIVRNQRESVALRLRELGGLTEDVLRRVIDLAYTQASDCTAHDPATYPGLVRWARGTRGLRDELVTSGWEPRLVSGFETTVHPKLGCAIVVAVGDARTGLPGQGPHTKTSKGPSIAKAIQANQLSFDQYERSWNPALSAKLVSTWVLLHHTEMAEDGSQIIRLELSLPRTMTKGKPWRNGELGPVVDWHERLILDEIRIAPTPTTVQNWDDGTSDFSVERAS